MPEVSRRQALRMAAAAPLVAPGIARAASRPERTPFALIGSGKRGQELLAHGNRLEGARCVAICDPHSAHAKKAASASRDKPQVYADHRQVLERGDVEAVLIATPLYTHFAMIKEALQAGKHVFCETTLVFQPAEIAGLREMAESSDQVIQVGLQRRYSQFYQTARQMASKGFLGEVTHIQAQWHRNPGWMAGAENGRGRQANWQLYREFSGGLTSEYAAHQIDLANWIFADTPESIVGAGGLTWRKDGRDVYDNISLIFNYPGGRRATFSCISTNKHLAMFGGSRNEAGEAILGTEGTIELTIGNEDLPALGLWYYEPTPKVTRGKESEELAKMAGATMTARREGFRPMPILLAADQFTGDESFWQRELKYTRRWLYSKGIVVPQETRHAVEAELDEFFTCCREGNRPKAHVDAGLDNSAAVYLANLAMDEKRYVRWDELTQGRK